MTQAPEPCLDGSCTRNLNLYPARDWPCHDTGEPFAPYWDDDGDLHACSTQWNEAHRLQAKAIIADKVAIREAREASNPTNGTTQNNRHDRQ